MCYHYAIDSNAYHVQERFPEISAFEEDYTLFEELYHVNAFNFQSLPIISSAEPKKWSFYNWGLIPFWAKDEKSAKQMRSRALNARSETVFEKPMFRGSIKSKRCLVPAKGFYEWRHHKGGKYPHYIHRKDEALFCFAGIWDRWVEKETGEVIESFSILTTAANPLMEKIHNSKKRMPLILPEDLEMQWLEPALKKDQVADLMLSVAGDDLEAYSISKLITSRTENSNVPAIKEAHEYAELVELD